MPLITVTIVDDDSTEEDDADEWKKTVGRELPCAVAPEVTLVAEAEEPPAVATELPALLPLLAPALVVAGAGVVA